MNQSKWPLAVTLWMGMVCAMAQSYPSQTIKIIVPFGSGSGSDIIARRLGIYLQERWKHPVVIENRPGAQGVIGTEALKSAPADGYTLGISTNSTHAVAPYLHKKLPYDPIKDFEHIALIGVGGSVALVPRESPFKSIAELVAYTNAHPGQVFFGHADTSSQIPGDLLKTSAKIPLEGVPYKAIASVVTDLIGGHIQLAFFNYMSASAQVANGRLVPIAITEAKRNARWPGIATIGESYPGYEVSFFAGISAPRGVPPDIVAKIHRALQEGQNDPAVKEPLESTGLTFTALPLGQYRAFILKEGERWREHVRAAKLEPQ
jgi:tripartite-type tricarboxylate transporter receptor subunit TctC